jgi:hypothetical protein
MPIENILKHVDGTSTVWDDKLASDADALAEARQCTKSE